jgi:hypothetical protein
MDQLASCIKKKVGFIMMKAAVFLLCFLVMGSLPMTLYSVGSAANLAQAWDHSQVTVGGLFQTPINILQVDTTPPDLFWIMPVGDTQVYNVCNQIILLEVDASDGGGINRVVFKRWDYVNLQKVELGTLYSAPYRVSLDTTPLLPNWNQVIAYAYDNAGNKTEKYIWLNHINNCKLFLPLIALN